MQFQTKAIVLGIKMFKGDVEGTIYDNTKVYVQIDLDASRGTAKGFAVQEMSYGTSEEFNKLKHNTFPMECELTIAMVTSGKTTKQQLIALKPLVLAKPAASVGA